jgi:hypothetical protein
MKFTPSQVRLMLGIGEETLRYWKRALAPLSEKRGHAPCYTHGDLLAMLVVARLVRDFRIEIGSLGSRAPQLFAACHQSQWPRLPGSILSIGASNVVVHYSGQIQLLAFAEPCVVLPLGLMLDGLKATLVAQDADTQLELSLPPVAVASGIKKG